MLLVLTEFERVPGDSATAAHIRVMPAETSALLLGFHVRKLPTGAITLVCLVPRYLTHCCKYNVPFYFLLDYFL